MTHFPSPQQLDAARRVVRAHATRAAVAAALVGPFGTPIVAAEAGLMVTRVCEALGVPPEEHEAVLTALAAGATQLATRTVLVGAGWWLGRGFGPPGWLAGGALAGGVAYTQTLAWGEAAIDAALARCGEGPHGPGPGPAPTRARPGPVP